MSTTTNKGIDYGLGRTNRASTGIRFGVISQNAVGQAWYDEAEADYGEACCPKCGNKAEQGEGKSEQLGNGVAVWTEHTKEREEYPLYRKHGCCGDYACDNCEIRFDGEDAFGDEPNGFSVSGEIDAHCGQDGDIFVTSSPYFTYAQFCSPCAPGACYLANPIDEHDDNNRAYCFGHDWFEDGIAPYPVYSVETGELVSPEAK